MTSRDELISYLRGHIVGAMHVGQLAGGDRLPSIRDVGKQLGRNPRTIRAAYAVLEKEGLVEVRGRAGVFVARPELPNGEAIGEAARWVSSVVAEGWKRRIAVTDLPQLLRRFTASVRVRCALIEPILDASVALEHELVHDWGFDVTVVAPGALDQALHTDFLATTSFHAPAVHAAAERMGKPLVVLTVHSALKAALAARIRESHLTVVAVDPHFVERIRVAYAPDDAARVRFLSASDKKAIAKLDASEPILLTRAARQRIGDLRVPLVFPHSPTISQETAHTLAHLLVRLNLSAPRQSAG
jgi:DNA-binding transcriptional regulator YhcF (GntR family)